MTASSPSPESAPEAETASAEPAATMTVRVRDRGSESPWGSGLTNPVVRTVTISAACPKCGGPRGIPRNLNQYDDGAHYSVDVWDNECGHVDSYAAVLAEASKAAV